MTNKRRTGRTTRMLEYALQRSRNGQQTVIFGKDATHVETLSLMLEQLMRIEDDLQSKIMLLAFRDLKQRPLAFTSAGAGYDYQKGTIVDGDADTEYLFDHMTLEHALRHVIHYLESVKRVDNVPLWMANTGMALTSLGRKVYLIVEDQTAIKEIRNLVGDFSHSLAIETGLYIGNLDWPQLTLLRAHPNVQLLFDPSLVRAKFEGSLNEMRRWG